jgi:acetyl-CoA C-acetyltransferase
MTTEAYIYDAIRTPRGRGKAGVPGKPAGSLYEVKPIDLVTNLLDAMQSRNELDTTQIDDMVLATGEPIGEQGQNLAKTALVYSDWNDITTGAQLHRYCAGGLDAVNVAAMKVRSGFETMVIGGGVESMSRLGIGAGGAAVSDPWVSMRSYVISQGVAADLTATLEGFNREDVDRYALMSHQRAAHAQNSGYFQRSLVPVKDMNGVTILAEDESVRADVSIESLEMLQPSFRMFGESGHNELLKFKYPQVETIDHIHTAGNSSGIADGAALVLVGSEASGREQGLQPRARIVACATTGTEPTIMLAGPVPATQKALNIAGLTIDDIDLFELNEAFASVVLRYQKALGIADEKINVNGGAIAMGHPIGATGAMLVSTLLDELERRDLKRGLISLCAGGGIGIATIIERL